jgi:hypothetical protein
MKRIRWLLALAILIAAIVAPQPAFSQAVTDGPAVEVFTYGNVSEAKQERYLTAVRSAILFTSREFGRMPLTVVRLRLYETNELFARGSWTSPVSRKNLLYLNRPGQSRTYLSSDQLAKPCI